MQDHPYESCRHVGELFLGKRREQVLDPGPVEALHHYCYHAANVVKIFIEDPARKQDEDQEPENDQACNEGRRKRGGNRPAEFPLQRHQDDSKGDRPYKDTHDRPEGDDNQTENPCKQEVDSDVPVTSR